MGMIDLNESARSISDAASVGAIRPRSQIANFKLLSHARQFGIRRLRESCAIVTAVMLEARLNTPPTAQLLWNTSSRRYNITSAQVRTLIDNQAFNRAVDGYQSHRRRFRPECDCVEHE